MLLLSFYSILATLGFTILSNIRGKNLIIASIGGGLSWFIFLLAQSLHNTTTTSLFFASVAVSIYSEIMARLFKSPVTVFVICGILPLVPGNGMYYTMYETINGSTTNALHWGFQTFLSAGSIAIAIVLVSSITKLVTLKKRKYI